MYQLYSKPGCPYCTFAKQLLDFHDLEYEIYTLGEDFDRDEFMAMQTGHTTFPLIFLGSDEDSREYIGGYSELEEHLEEIL